MEECALFGLFGGWYWIERRSLMGCIERGEIIDDLDGWICRLMSVKVGRRVKIWLRWNAGS